MNNMVEVCLVGLWVGANYPRWLVLLYHPYLFISSVTLYALSEHRLSCSMPDTFFVPNCREGVEQNIPKGNYQDFLKWVVVFRSFSYNN